MLDLNAFVTPDERKWLARSANFYQAITHGDLIDTFQREHPGVTVMWAGTLGFLQAYPEYARQAPGQFEWEEEDLENWLHRNSDRAPLDLLVAGRRWVSLAIALAITLGFFPLRKLFDPPLAFVLSLFVAWSPFYIALSRQLHPDGLLASLLYLSLLGFLAWLYAGGARRYLILSGVALGLAGLTKTPAAFLAPTAAILVALEWLRRRRGDDAERRGSLWPGLLLWGVIAAATFVLLWPAMWVAPLTTLQRIVAEMTSYVEGHSNPNYFMGEVTRDPGPIFYPIAWLFRTTPAVLIGLIAALVFLLKKRWPFERAAARRTVGGLILFALIFAIGMTLGAKKFDRYVLPSFLALDVVAGLGWASLVGAALSWWGRRHGRDTEPGQEQAERRSALVALIALMIGAGLLHGLFAIRTYPYYLTYYNPLTGGSRMAERVLFVGWGEGLEQAAAWLNQQEDGDHLRAVSWYQDGPLSYYLKSEQPPLSYWEPDFWFDADYAVVYINQRQRQIPGPDAAAYFASLTPAHVVEADGFQLARIYDMRDKTPPAFSQIIVENVADFDTKIRLGAYSMGEQNFLPGGQFLIRLHLKSLQDLNETYFTTVRLLAPDGSEVWRSTNEQEHPWPIYQIRQDYHEIAIPESAPTGEYTIALSIYGDADLASPLPAASSGPLTDAHTAVVTTIDVQNAVQVDTDVNWGGVWLTDLQHEPVLEPGKSTFVRMQAEGETDGRFSISVRLVDEDGKTVAQSDVPLTADTQISFDLPADLSPGRYQIVAVVYDPETLASIPDKHDNHLVVLSEVEVRGGGEGGK